MFSIIYSIPKTLYSFLIGLLIGMLLNLLSSSKSQLIVIIHYETMHKIELLMMVKGVLKKYKIKLSIFLIVNFILIAFFWYYSAAFCAVYFNSQKDWFKGCLFSIMFTFLMPFIISLLFTVLRVISLQYKNEVVFNVLSIITGLL